MSAVLRHRESRAEQVARACDYLRTKRDIAEYIDDALLISDLRDNKATQQRANDLLDLLESMDMVQIGEFFTQRIIDAYSEKERE